MAQNRSPIRSPGRKCEGRAGLRKDGAGRRRGRAAAQSGAPPWRGSRARTAAGTARRPGKVGGSILRLGDIGEGRVAPEHSHGMKEPPRRWGPATLTRSALGEDISGHRAQSNRGAKRRQGSRRPHRPPDLGQKTRTASHQRHRWPKLCKLLSTTYITGWVFELEHRALHLFLLACSLDWFSGGIPGS